MMRTPTVGALLTLAAMLVTTLVAPSANAAPAGGKLLQFRAPTAGSNPGHITPAADGTFWFTETFINNQSATTHNVGRITATGAVTEFAVCDFCFPTDIVQGSDGNLYYTRNDAPLGRVAPDGTDLGFVGQFFQFNGNGLAAHGDDIWVSDFNNDSVWRYDIPTDALTQFPAPSGAVPFDVAVDADGIVWFTDGNGSIGRLDPATGATTLVPVTGFPRQIRVASDGAVWFTERFTPQGVGRLDPVTLAVTLFPLDGGPEDLAPTPDGGMWVTRSTAGNIVRLAADGTVTTASKVVKGSEPFGITVAPDGNPWFAMMAADKIGQLVLP